MRRGASMSIKKLSIRNDKEVLKLLRMGVCTVVDDHVTHTVKELTIHGYVIMNTEIVCPIFTDITFSLNRLYVNREDGKIHLSRVSIGGYLMPDKFDTFEECVQEYNKNSMFRTITSFELFK